MTTQEIIERLANHRTIGNAPREELRWIAAHGNYRTLLAGEVLTRPEDTVDVLVLMFTGRLAHFRVVGAGQRKVAEVGGGEAGGLLPFSRLRIAGGTTVVEEPGEAIMLDRKEFPGLIRNCPEATGLLVHVMTDRARYFTSAELRDEKMISLGKLAAGLAHELNNPASAAVRDAKEMTGALKHARDAAHELGRAGLAVEQRAGLEEIQTLCTKDGAHTPVSGLALADREEEIAEWLSVHDVRNSLAEDLAGSSLTIPALDRVAARVPRASLEVALRWIVAECTVQSLSLNIERAAGRIHALVSSVKGFTRMDTARDEGPVDIPSGLSDTVALLQGKARKKSVEINLKIPDRLPHVRGLGAEINQVWMNLIDNAIDAVPLNGRVDVTVMHEGPAVLVRVVDDGPGIPPEIKGNIFDPFFTTKPAGEGTGLGLDIVRRVLEWHNGQVRVESQPGRTEFLVELPCMGADGDGPAANS